MFCCVLLCCFVMLCFVLLCYVTLFLTWVRLCCVLGYYDMLCYAMLCSVLLCYVKLWYVRHISQLCKRPHALQMDAGGKAGKKPVRSQQKNRFSREILRGEASSQQEAKRPARGQEEASKQQEASKRSGRGQEEAPNGGGDATKHRNKWKNKYFHEENSPV